MKSISKRAVAANIAAVAAARVTAKKKIIVLQRRNKKKDTNSVSTKSKLKHRLHL